MGGILGLGGGQGIFLREAAPAVLLGIAAFVWLPDKPEHATWLAPEQRQWLSAKLAGERQRAPRISHESVWRVVAKKKIMFLAVGYSRPAGAPAAPPPLGPPLVEVFRAPTLERCLGA